jgi:hypothetical protein
MREGSQFYEKAAWLPSTGVLLQAAVDHFLEQL